MTPLQRQESTWHDSWIMTATFIQVSTNEQKWFTDVLSNAVILLCLQAQRDFIFELRRIAFDGDNDPSATEKRKAIYTKDYKMLGFTVSHDTSKELLSALVMFKMFNASKCTQNAGNPALDFTQSPPGMLALDNMLYLAKLHQDTYIRVRTLPHICSLIISLHMNFTSIS